MPAKEIFRVIFQNHEQCYEVYAEKVYPSDMYGFIVIEHMLFGEKSRIVIDPAEEKLKSEFQDVERTFVPMHHVIRVDQVSKQGTPKIWSSNSSSGNVAQMPSSHLSKKPSL